MTKTGQLLSDLISLPSVNPAFLPADNPHSGELLIGEYLSRFLRKHGLEVEFQKVQPQRQNLLAYLSPSSKIRQRVLLAPHLDTVGGAKLPGNLFTPRVKKGRLYGRGACDTKGSVAAMVAALCELAESKHRPAQTEIVFAGLVDE